MEPSASSSQKVAGGTSAPWSVVARGASASASASALAFASASASPPTKSAGAKAMKRPWSVCSSRVAAAGREVAAGAEAGAGAAEVAAATDWGQRLERSMSNCTRSASFC